MLNVAKTDELYIRITTLCDLATDYFPLRRVVAVMVRKMGQLVARGNWNKKIWGVK